MKKVFMSPLIVFVIAITFCGTVASCHSGTTLSASVTANAHYQTKYKWTIDKTANPDTFINLPKDETCTSQYTVSVTKDAGTKTAWIDGDVTVTNGGEVPTEGLSIKVKLTKPSSQSVIASAEVDTSSHPVLAPGETHTYHYRINIPVSDISSGSNYKVTSDITITNYSDHPGTPFGPSRSATTKLPEPTLINDVVHVTDTNGESWTFDKSGLVTYYRTFSYKGNLTDIYNNTATIQETGQSANATVTVNWDPPADPSIDDPIIIGANASVLSPSQSQSQSQAQSQAQTSNNGNSNILSNNNIHAAFSDSSANNRNNLTNTNTQDPAMNVSSLNGIGNAPDLAAIASSQIPTVKSAKIVKKQNTRKRNRRR